MEIQMKIGGAKLFLQKGEFLSQKLKLFLLTLCASMIIMDGVIMIKLPDETVICHKRTGPKFVVKNRTPGFK